MHYNFLRPDDLHLPHELEYPAEEGRGDLNIYSSTETVVPEGNEFGVLAELIVDAAISELSNWRVTFAVRRHTCRTLFHMLVDRTMHIQRLKADIGVLDIHGLHAIDTINRSAVILLTVCE